MAIITLLLVLLVAAILVGYFCLLPPKKFPRQIPTIPFFVSLIPFFKTVDQSDIYRQYLEEPLASYGVVNFFFGARWNILITRPEYVAEMFKDEEVFAKSGNQKKIPYSVLAQYTGDNIISSHGENWRLYQSILKPGLQRSFDVEPIYNNAVALLHLLRGERHTNTSGGVVVPQLFQRYTLANLSQVLLCTSFKASSPRSNDSTMVELQSNLVADSRDARCSTAHSSARCQARDFQSHLSQLSLPRSATHSKPETRQNTGEDVHR